MIKVNCNLCGRDEWQVRYPSTMNGRELDVSVFRCTSPGYGQHAQIVQCNHCGLVYANPRWSQEALLAAYAAVEDETYQAERHGRELTFRHHLDELEKRIGPAHSQPANRRSLLDVGAYIGVFVEMAAASGWQATGVEPSAWAVGQAQSQGLNVIQGTLDSPELAGRQFDVITWWDVVEHLDDPAAEIAKSFQTLRPGGWLVMHTMDVDSLTARLLGRRWPWLMDMHLYYFSRKSLAQMLEKAGFEAVESAVQGRYLSLGYLVTRLTAWNRRLGQIANRAVNALHLNHTEIPVNFGDLFTIYGRKPESK